MMRDFMGLNSVKEEVSYGVSDSVAVATAKVQGTQWPLSRNVDAVPHFSSHIYASKDTPNKAASSGSSQNLAGFIFKSSPSAVLNTGRPDARKKSAESPAQMTIFYNGTVKVYDSITPEKAQAIMFLAGNASCLVTSDARAGALVRSPTLKFSQCVNVQPFPTISSPVSVSAHNGGQSMSSSTSKNTPSPFSPDCKMDPLAKPMTAFGSAAAPSMIPQGVPQFRKVSLARFLVKRRERVMNAAPYNAAKKPESASCRNEMKQVSNSLAAL